MIFKLSYFYLKKIFFRLSLRYLPELAFPWVSLLLHLLVNFCFLLWICNYRGGSRELRKVEGNLFYLPTLSQVNPFHRWWGLREGMRNAEGTTTAKERVQMLSEARPSHKQIPAVTGRCRESWGLLSEYSLSTGTYEGWSTDYHTVFKHLKFVFIKVNFSFLQCWQTNSVTEEDI